ncbi:L,D-transpeptidase family protein [Pedobacter sp. MW01-1-1]|uniref:L,D-transpeptidase family protein n=1 Tax=Pedobacter sp. MW01-1-1 TaxID=3383027 RepID=UPI003FEE2623
MNLKQNHTAILYSLIFMFSMMLFQSCKKSNSDLGRVLAKETGNKLFKEISLDELQEKLQVELDKRSQSLRNPRFTKAMYAQHNYQPLLIEKYFADSGLKKAAARISKSTDHGLSPTMFGITRFDAAIQSIYEKSKVKNLEEAYAALINLELSASASIDHYSEAMDFGVLSPRRIFAQYYTKTKRPDTLSFNKIYQTKNIVTFLDSIQPEEADYLFLQDALKQAVVAPAHSLEETKRIIAVNMERLRWKNTPTENKYVWVNIPEFELRVMEKGNVALEMKVCVGEGRNTQSAPALEEYDEDDLKKDRPFNRETPQLKSMIHSVQVNPVWNIPESIATNEITKYAAQDRYYLENNNIDVFYKGKLVEDPETIDWSASDAGKTYTFKQRPGDDNSLGKIKFLFDNQSSVYLHDTPAKAAFNKPVRAVSHGCVRVEKPLDLAKALFGAGEKFNKISQEMKSKNPIAENISLPEQVPVYLSYFTCWKDSNGKLMFANDVYGLDAVLFTHLSN